MAKRQVVRYVRKQDSGRTTYKQRERILQRSLTRWLNEYFPEVDFYNDWSAGAFLTHGQNAARLAMTSNNGWVDTFIAEPSNGHHGLFLELKKEGTKIYLKDGKTLVADSQIRKEAAFLARQQKKGYCAVFACGEEDAKNKICKYLGTDRPDISPTLF
jgi:hypothetical protein